MLDATKPDLIDRGIIIEHKPIPREKKRLLKDIWEKFYQIRRGLLGYILDILVKVLQYEKQNPEGLKLKEYPRLADFAVVCEVVSRCMGNPSDQFIRAYFANIELQTREVIESHLVGKAIEIFINRYQKKNKASE